MKIYDSIVSRILERSTLDGILQQIEIERRMAARGGRQEEPETLNYIAHLEEAATRMAKGGAFA